jgi:uncharacterized membrane protein
VRPQQAGPSPGHPTVVVALAAGRSTDHRRVLVREWFRERFWALPSLLLVSGVLLGIVTTKADARRSAGADGRPDVGAGAADTLLGIIATSMLTFVGVVFTMTLVALQLASAQLSPRVLRTFVRSSLTKAAFGVFLATFAFAMTVLALDQFRTADADDAGTVDSLAVTVASMLVAGSVLIFVAYVTATMRLLQVSWVITAVATETRQAVAVNFPPAEAYVQTDPPVLSRTPALVRLPLHGRRALGVLLGIDRARLVEIARRHGCVLELIPAIGSYVDTGAEVFAVHGGGTPSDGQVLACVELGRARSLYQDPSFGLRQLVDVATQALSPALNQPTTATQVLDRIEDVLLRVVRRPPAAGRYVDVDGVVRLLEHAASWDELLDLAFTEITLYGASSPQVARRLMAAYDALAAAGPSHLRPSIEVRRSALVEVVRANTMEALCVTSPRPDRLGLG